MRISKQLVGGMLVLSGLVVAGCPQSILTVPVAFELGNSLGGFEVVAGVPTQNRGTGGVGDAPITIGSGTLTLDPAAITITPAEGGPGKSGVNQQTVESLIVTAWIAPVADLATVCETGEEYGPFTVEVDENYVPQSVDPSSVALTQDTIDLINVGEFSLCLEVTSPVTGTVTIERLNFRVGL